MRKMITTTEQAIDFLEKKAGISVKDVSSYKYKVFDEDFTDFIKTDKELIEYAKEQQEAMK